MKPTMTLLPALGLLWCLPACYQSGGLHDDDASTDAIPDTITDSTGDEGTDAVRPDDGTTDSTPDDAVVDVEPDVPPANYVLHEWGVMVMEEGGGASMHGPSPDFTGAIPAKPVLYLYADEPIAPLTIAVDFASGASTDVWPAIPLGPRVAWNDLTLRPGPCTTTAFPDPWDDDRWEEPMCEACNLESCVVSDADCLDYTNAAGETTVANLLFYTGSLPDYRAPLEATAAVLADPTFPDRLALTITNRTSRTVEDVWFVYRQTTDTCIDPSLCSVTSADLAWARFDEIAGGSSESGIVLDIVHVESAVGEEGDPVGELPLPEGWSALGADLTAELLERGLTTAEAEAFMRNWETIYFGLMGADSVYVEPFYRDGAALIYFMSEEDYDAQLPLAANPPPVETVRLGMIYQHLP